MDTRECFDSEEGPLVLPKKRKGTGIDINFLYNSKVNINTLVVNFKF